MGGYSRTGLDCLTSSLLMQGNRVKLTMYDTSGEQGSNPGREVAYREADVFLVCYKICSPSSLFSAINHWVPEVRGVAPMTPLLLVGCQTDLRGDRTVLAALSRQGRSPVSTEQARSFSQQIEAVGYLETSAKASSKGPESVFQLAAQISLEQCSRDTFPSVSTLLHPSRPLSSFSRSTSLSSSVSSSLDSTRSSLSLPRVCSPVPRRRHSLSHRSKPSSSMGTQGMVTIRCQRLTTDMIYEEVEIEVPAPIYETLQACNEQPTLSAPPR